LEKEKVAPINKAGSIFDEKNPSWRRMLGPHAGGRVGSHQTRGNSWTVGWHYDVTGRNNALKEGNYRGKFRKELRRVERK
jgi:hypothetical protein